MLNEHSSGHTLTYQRHAFAHATHSAGSPYFACCDRTQTTKRFIKASKRDACVISPQKSFGLGIWIQISWVICYELSLAIRINLQRAVFSLFWAGEGEGWCVCLRVTAEQLQLETDPTSQIPNSNFTLPSHCSSLRLLSLPVVCRVFHYAASLACQMVFEWILKSRLHWTSIIFLRFFLVVLKKALLNDSLEAHLQKQNYS